jgi:histidinol dehydrogenase
MLKVFTVSDDASLAQAAAWFVRREDESAGDMGIAEKLDSVRQIVEDVRTRGDEAVAEYTERFERVRLTPDRFEIGPDELEQAVKEADRGLVAALERAHDNIRRFHEKNLLKSWEETHEDGTTLGQRVTPIESAGLFVPGATAFYPSSALMNLVPAKVAGVETIVMVSPPTYNGSIHPLALAAARIGGADRIFRVSGTAGVAALAYGTETIPQVTKITGPGSIYVTLAKRLVSSVCDIDKEAGPSDVVVIADETTDPKLAAIEMMCQAEHNEDSPTTLICLTDTMAAAVQDAVAELLPTLSRAQTISKALENYGAIFIVRNLDDAVSLTNVIAPEHLAIQTEFPIRVFDKVKHAGAIMLGSGTPVSVSDYYAGPNHILPTGRRARFASPLTVEDFRKVTNFVSYSRERMRRDADDIIRLANAEQLTAHARAVELRI